MSEVGLLFFNEIETLTEETETEETDSEETDTEQTDTGDPINFLPRIFRYTASITIFFGHDARAPCSCLEEWVDPNFAVFADFSAAPRRVTVNTTPSDDIVRIKRQLGQYGQMWRDLRTEARFQGDPDWLVLGSFMEYVVDNECPFGYESYTKLPIYRRPGLNDEEVLLLEYACFNFEDLALTGRHRHTEAF